MNEVQSCERIWITIFHTVIHRTFVLCYDKNGESLLPSYSSLQTNGNINDYKDAIAWCMAVPAAGQVQGATVHLSRR